MMKKVTMMIAMIAALGMFGIVSFGQDGPPPGDGEGPGMHGKGGKRGMGGRRGGHRGKRGMRGGKRGGLMRMLKDLDLSDSQKTQVQKIIQDDIAKNKASFEANKEKMKELFAAKRSGLATEAQEAEIKALGEARKANREALEKSIMGVLNADQRAKVEAKKAEMEKRKAEMEKRREERKAKRDAAKTSS